MRKAIWLVAVAVLCTWTAVAMANGPNSARKRAEASMQVTGQIDIEADGSVSDYRIDHLEKLSPNLVSQLKNAVESWKFEPTLVGDRPVAVSTKVSVLLIAKPADNGSHSVRIGGAAFDTGEDSSVPKTALIGKPRYPMSLAEHGATAMVYLVLKVGRQGTVEDVIVEQVNLRVVAGAGRMTQMRNDFANSALKAARGWTFTLPVAGPEVDASHWSLRVPVDFILSDGSTVNPEDEYGRWIGYVPGPRHSIPWLDKDEEFQAPPDAMVAGNFYSSRNSGPRLLTALGSD